ncbi:hypothetical protein DBR32_13480 [Taibaiella sp. KBW10]|uniref:hypothetical protein n=1 Tax=Taibaiella sp. KBW10 TaxID=2153357 RepID=UPI000F5AED70|nr:hypothetical protein [Taibaiella sp. KBW10]RQO30563.1 hypothetical protein DBR32_13480 [Taibaiella sp. KBW10]
MHLYKLFITAFVLSIVSGIIFFAAYMSGIFELITLMPNTGEPSLNEPYMGNPFLLFKTLLSPTLIVSLIVLSISSLLNKVLGIVFIARNPTISEGTKVIWILGFVFASFIASIVFFVLRRSNNLLATKETRNTTAFPEFHQDAYS